MNRSELQTCVTAVCNLVKEPSVIIFGSQSILGSFDDSQLPDEATISREVDAVPTSFFQVGAEDVDKRESINTHLGEHTAFHQANGFFVEGISLYLPAPPMGWDNRLVPFPHDGGYGHTGLCLDPIDLCATKIIVGRPKDKAFLAALVDVGLVNPVAVADRIKAGIAWPDSYQDDKELAIGRALSHLEWLSNQ